MHWLNCGIKSLSCYVPEGRLSVGNLHRVWGKLSTSSATKSVPSFDEDATTLATTAARRLRKNGADKSVVDCVWVGSESKPYAVKTSAATVASCLGLSNSIGAADIEFACRGAIEAMLRLSSSIETGSLSQALVVASDCAQAPPGDPLEATASAAAVALVLAQSEECPIQISQSCFFVTDTTDFHRRDGQKFPTHANRFTGVPAYFHHVTSAVNSFFEKTNSQTEDFRYVVFHQPNQRFAKRVGSRLGFNQDQIAPVLFANRIGNPHAANVFVGIAQAVSLADTGDKILVASYGSGAGSDAFAIKMNRPFQLDSASAKDLALDGQLIESYSEYMIHTRQLVRGQ